MNALEKILCKQWRRFRRTCINYAVDTINHEESLKTVPLHKINEGLDELYERECSFKYHIGMHYLRKDSDIVNSFRKWKEHYEHKPKTP